MISDNIGGISVDSYNNTLSLTVGYSFDIAR